MLAIGFVSHNSGWKKSGHLRAIAESQIRQDYEDGRWHGIRPAPPGLQLEGPLSRTSKMHSDVHLAVLLPYYISSLWAVGPGITHPWVPIASWVLPTPPMGNSRP